MDVNMFIDILKNNYTPAQKNWVFVKHVRYAKTMTQHIKCEKHAYGSFQLFEFSQNLCTIPGLQIIENRGDYLDDRLRECAMLGKKYLMERLIQ